MNLIPLTLLFTFLMRLPIYLPTYGLLAPQVKNHSPGKVKKKALTLTHLHQFLVILCKENTDVPRQTYLHILLANVVVYFKVMHVFMYILYTHSHARNEGKIIKPMLMFFTRCVAIKIAVCCCPPE